MIEERIFGVYSAMVAASGGGHREIARTLFLAKEKGGRVFLRRLDGDGVPDGPEFAVDRVEFLSVYEKENDAVPDFETSVPVLTWQAVDEEKAEEMFDPGVREYEEGDRSAGLRKLEAAIDFPGRVTMAHKHMFNGFGTWLRWAGLDSLSVRCFERGAAGGGDMDENFLFNMARAYHASGRKDDARRVLRACLSKNPDMDAARKFLRYLKDQTEEETYFFGI